jgi:predicted dehydrogenase
MIKEVCWGFIGCGDVTEKKSGPAFNKVEDSRVVAVMRRNGKLAKDYAHRHNVPKWYDDPDKLLSDPEVNAIYIATPPLYHKEYTIRALEAGKAVYVEKPMAARYEDCLEMNLAAEKAGLPLFVAYYRRTLPYFLKVRELIESGKVGKIRLIRMKLLQPQRPEDLNSDDPPWRLIPEIAGGGYFYDLACHQIDFLYFLFGEIKEISSLVRNFAGIYKPEDTIFANMAFENGILLHGSWSFTAPVQAKADFIEMIGEKGKITFSTFDLRPIIINSSEVSATYNIAHPENIQLYMISSVVDELLGRGNCSSTGKTGAHTNWVMDKILGKI